MTIDDVRRALAAATVVCGRAAEADTVGGVVASDLMSDVLTVDQEGFVLVTSLVSDQVIRTADIVGAAAVVIANDKLVGDSMRALAERQRVCILRTAMSTFDACRALSRLMDTETS